MTFVRKVRLLFSTKPQVVSDPIVPQHVDWDSRYKIIGGIARGLLYFHEDSPLRIIHRDISPGNILLDEDWNPKISDFGIASLLPPDEPQGTTDIIVGTCGYMAPECIFSGHFSVKSDVFSFGVVVLEVITGQKSSRFAVGGNAEDFLSYAWRNWREGTPLNLVDRAMRAGSSFGEDMLRCIQIGLLCVQVNEADRPTMSSVVLMLSSLSPTLPEPTQPSALYPRSPHMSPLREYVQNAEADESYWRSQSVEFSVNEEDRRSQSIEFSVNEEDRRRSDQFSGNEDSITDLYPR